ncbi:hypothetical protein GW943_02875 [Candidatus Parcubacteria bacterium]|uniref:Uncharacterized protein n=1 Tax=Candidatus Kaiserbacteria bacterium CG10_big_fil_rev_8_21_14_0_10_47_16 TaxID=1974608 RepID=A0A2H0UE39_9BACT|nr:hypothetical protein [Candidatus Parcubacteria bacterium]PIR84620.1 MAG: hypothetical protein COU16_03540 [Candidatus Kaiserbacteria bacterium CG10_big_fil_rev_8_21_14_0_10_47_16]
MRGGGIKKVADLFETYRTRLKAPQKTVINTFTEVVSDVCGFSLRTSDVSYTPSSKTLSLKAAGPLKTEILLRKQELLIHMKGRLGASSAPNEII